MRLFEIGRIARPHGVRGGLRVTCRLDDPSVLAGMSEILVGRTVHDARPRQIRSLVARRDFLLAEFTGVTDRESAMSLCGDGLFIPRDRLPDPPEGEYYWQDLIGLTVRDEQGRILGRIDAIFPTGGHDVYVCRGPEGEVLLPGVEQVIRRVDLDSGSMIVRLPDGL